MSPDSQEFGGCIILTRSVPTKHLSSTRAVKSLSHRSRESTIGPKKVQTGKTQAICVRLWISSFCPFLNFGNRLPSALFGKNCHSRMVCGSLRQNGMACAENEFGDKAVGITRCFGMASELVAIHFETEFSDWGMRSEFEAGLPDSFESGHIHSRHGSHL